MSTKPLEQPLDLLEKFTYHPIYAFKSVRKNSFRSTVSFEDLHSSIQEQAKTVVYEKTLEGELHPTTITGIFEVKYPIQILDTYNPFARAMENIIDNDNLTEELIAKFSIEGYENPGLDNAPTKRFMANVCWLTLINRGINYFATKKLATYIINNIVQRHTVTHEKMMNLLEELQTWEESKLWDTVEDYAPNKLKTVGIFYGNNSEMFKAEQEIQKRIPAGEFYSEPTPYNCELLTQPEKMVLAREYSNKRLKKAQRHLISVGISELVNVDQYTKITDARLEEITGLGRKTIARKKSVRQKSSIKRLNSDRHFKTRTTSTNYELFVLDHHIYGGMTGTQVAKDLGISKTTYVQFKKMYEEGL